MVLAHPGRRERKQRQPEQQVQVRPQDAAAHVRGGMQQVVVIVPVDADVDEAQHVAQEDRQQRPQRRRSRRRAGTFSSSTMMVMMIASTPSLKASSRFFSIRRC